MVNVTALETGLWDNARQLEGARLKSPSGDEESIQSSGSERFNFTHVSGLLQWYIHLQNPLR